MGAGQTWAELARQLEKLVQDIVEDAQDPSLYRGLAPRTEAPIFGLLRSRGGTEERDVDLAGLTTEIVDRLRHEAAVQGFWDNPVSQEAVRRAIVQNVDMLNLFAFEDLDRISSEIMSVASESERLRCMNDFVLIDGLEFRVTRSKRRGTVGLTIERDRTLTMVLPEDLPLDQASEAVAGRVVWVHQKLAKHRGAARLDVLRQPALVDGEGFHFLGQHFRLKLVDPDPAQRTLPAIRLQGSICSSAEIGCLPDRSGS